MNETRPKHQRRWLLLFALLGGLGVLFGIIGVGLLLYLRTPSRQVNPSPGAEYVFETDPQPPERDFGLTNIVSIELGGEERGQGLIHVDSEKDGATEIASINGVNARLLRLNERSEAYFYFRIDPTFKANETRRARIEVEYLAHAPGTLGMHYDALDELALKKSAYKSAGTERLIGTNVWQKATFFTRSDAGFLNRQNGQADFRFVSRTPELYVRRVTLTRESVTNEWPADHSTNASVTILLGEEKLEDGVHHLANESDGRTSITNLNGVVCRHMNRARDGKTFGFVYFVLSPSFKSAAITNARVEVEYLAPRRGHFRLQFDGVRNGEPHDYVTTLANGMPLVRFGSSQYSRITETGTWQVATFDLREPRFANGQNGGADFRFEVVPPEIFVRRVSVTRQ